MKRSDKVVCIDASDIHPHLRSPRRGLVEGNIYCVERVEKLSNGVRTLHIVGRPTLHGWRADRFRLVHRTTATRGRTRKEDRDTLSTAFRMIDEYLFPPHILRPQSGRLSASQAALTLVVAPEVFANIPQAQIAAACGLSLPDFMGLVGGLSAAMKKHSPGKPH